MSQVIDWLSIYGLKTDDKDSMVNRDSLMNTIQTKCMQ